MTSSANFSRTAPRSQIDCGKDESQDRDGHSLKIQFFLDFHACLGAKYVRSFFLWSSHSYALDSHHMAPLTLLLQKPDFRAIRTHFSPTNNFTKQPSEHGLNPLSVKELG